MKFGTWNVRSPYRAGDLGLETSELEKYEMDNMRNWVHSALDRDYWRALVNVASNLRGFHNPWS
jgi:hypothetical protein